MRLAIALALVAGAALGGLPSPMRTFAAPGDPLLTKAFSPNEIPLHGRSTLTFTITNNVDALARPGWSFTDTLPVNLTVAAPPVASTTCTGGAVVAAAGGSTISVNGNLGAGQASCLARVDVTASAAGTFQNCAGNLTNLVSINPPAGCATLTCSEYTGDLPDFFVNCPAPGEPAAVAFAIKQRWQTGNITVAYQTPVVGDLYGTGQPMAVVASNVQYTTGTGVPTRLAGGLNIVRASDGVLVDTIATPRFGWSGHAVMAIADVDGDGLGEIILKASNYASVAIAHRGRLVAYHYDPVAGAWAEMWVSSQRYDLSESNGRGGASLAFADFNADGVAEVYVGDQIFNARTGAFLTGGTTTQSAGCPYRGEVGCFWAQSTAVDMDDDGQLELVAGDAIYDVNIPNGTGAAGNSLTLAVQAAALAGVVGDGWTAVADMDLDGRPDVVVVRTTTTISSGQTRLFVYDGQTGAIKGSLTGIGTRGGAPMLGDIDGDGAPEIVFQNTNALRAFDFVPGVGLASKWTISTADGSGLTSLSMFDFNNDGKQELVYRDEDNLRIIDGSGATATNLAIFPCSSGTATELPIVADIDGSGEARILVNCQAGAANEPSQLRAFESGSADKWSNTRPVWNQQAYFAAHIQNDLTVPAAQAPHWTAFDDAAMQCSNGVSRPFNSFQQQMTDLDPDTGCPVICDPPTDFGDAPTSYGTTLADDGARHLIVDYDQSNGTSPLMLGSNVDPDPDGLAGPAAASDVGDDGVAAAIELFVGVPTSVTVTATNDTDVAATLAGWIDLDGNATFDPSELVTVTVPALSGAADYVLTFPANAALAPTYARFRLFPEVVAAPLPTGLATAGEVEDYRVTAVAAPALSLVKSASPDTVGPVGSIIVYSFVATNTGNVTLSNVTIEEGTFTGSGPQPIAVCPPGAASLAPGASVTCTATYTLTQTDVNTGQVTNTATATGTPPAPGTPPPTSPPSTEIVTIPPTPALTIVKSATPSDAASFNVGQLITYSFVIANTGNVTLTSVGIDETDFTGSDPHGPIICDAGVNGSFALDSGAQAICTMTYTLTLDDVNAGTLFNEATATGTPPTGPSIVSDPDDVTLPGDPQPAISIAKTAVRTGQQVTYTFVATNTGNVSLSDVAIVDFDFSGTDPLPAITCPPAAPTTLVPGQTLTCTAIYTLTQPDVDAGIVTNTAAATGTSPGGDPVTSTPDDATVTIAPQPGLTIVKSADPQTAGNVDDEIEYVFVVTNTGNVTLTDVAIDDSDFSGTGTLATPTCDASLAALAPGGVVTCTAVYELTQLDVDAGAVTNSATATGTPPTGPPIESPPDDATVTVPPAPALTIAKSANPQSTGAAGDVITYTFVVTNTGNVTLTGVHPIEGPFSGTGTLLPITCPAAPATTLAPGGILTCATTYVLTQDDVDAGRVTNSATATGTPPGPGTPPPTSPPDNETIVVPQNPALTVVKSADPQTAGSVDELITYTFVITNTGNVTLTDVHPIEGAFSGSGNLSTIVCDAGVASLAPEATVECTATYRLTQPDVDSGELTNTATATGVPPGDLDPPTSPPTGVEIEIPPAPGFVVTKSATPNDQASFVLGQTIVYRFVGRNTGNVTLTDVTIEDTSFSGDGSLSDIVCPGGNGDIVLAPGAQVMCLATYTLTQADIDAGTVTNTAGGTATPPTGPPPVSPPSEVEIPGDPQPALTIEKSSDLTTSPARPGDVITYTFLIVNTGNVTLTDVHPVEGAFSGTGEMSAIVCGAAAASLLPGAAAECTATYMLTQADVDAGQITNTATATGTPPGPGTPPPTSPPDTNITIVPSAPGFRVVKSVTPNDIAAFVANGDLTYQFVGTNTGNVTLSGVTIEDLDFSGSGPLGPITCDLGVNGDIVLGAGQQVVCTAAYTVTQADIDAAHITNTAGGTGTPPTGPPPVSPPTTVEFPGDPHSGITIEKFATPATGGAEGDVIIYTFRIENTGDVTLTDVHPIEGDFSGTGDLSTITCPTGVAKLLPGEIVDCTATYTLTQPDVDMGQITNSATATGVPPTGFEPPTSPPSTTTVEVPPAPGLTVDKTASPASIGAAGQYVTYTFAITNTGNVTLTNVHPTEENFSGDDVMSEISCDAGAASLAPAETIDCTAIYQLTQDDIDAGKVTNIATATGTPPDPSTPPPTSPPDIVIVAVPSAPSLTVAKTANPAVVDEVGELVTYSFRVENTGNVTLTGVTIDDSDFGGSGPLGPIVCPAVTNGEIVLAPTGTITCTATYTITQDDVDDSSVANTAGATGTPPHGPDVVAPPSTAIVTVPPREALTIVKSATPNSAADFIVGHQITYSFVITNTGNVTLTDVGVVEGDFTGSGDLSPLGCGDGPISLGSGEQVTCTASYVLTQTDIDATSVRNTATATGTPPDNDPIESPPGETTVPGEALPAITLLKSANPVAVSKAGEVIIYSFLITNTGNTTLHDATVVEGAFTGTGTLSPVTCPPASATMLPGAQVTCTTTYMTTQADVDGDAISNTATATATPPPGIDPPVSPPSTTTVTSNADGKLTLIKTAAAVDANGNGVTDIGDRIEWTLVVTNIGAATVSGITVSDPTAGAVTCPASSLTPGTSMTCTAPAHTITAADAAARGVHNVATASGDGDRPGDLPISTPPATADIAVQAIPPAKPDPGELPATGSNSTATLQVIAILLLSGLALLIAARRRHPTR